MQIITSNGLPRAGLATQAGAVPQEDFALRRRRAAAFRQYNDDSGIRTEFRSAEDYADFTERERAAGMAPPQAVAPPPPASQVPGATTKPQGAIAAHLHHLREARAQGRR